MKTTEEKIRYVLEDKRMLPEQRELVTRWYKHLKKSQPTNAILERAYTIREIGLLVNKPFQKLMPEDINIYVNNKIKAVKDGSAKAYRFRIQGFYRYLYKHTRLDIDKELAYPTPKIVVREHIPKEDRHRRRIEALLNNKVLSQIKRDKGLSNEELRKKYPEKVLKEHNLKMLREFYNYKITSGLVTSHVGFTTKLSFLKRFGLYLNDKTYAEATREDIQEFLAQVQVTNGKINPSYKAFLLDFYRFVYGMFGNEQPRKYPDVVSWLYTKRKKINDRLAKAIISDIEIKAMIDACDNLRDKAIIAVLRDCSARIGELMDCRIKDVQITEKGRNDSKYKHQIATIKLKGKTGERLNLLHWSVSYLRQWILAHPLRTKPDFENAPLFVARKESRYGQPLTAVGVNKMLQKVATRTGIKRHIHCHLFRHTNLTHMAKILSETELKIHAGWGSDSKMASVYVHLSHEDVHNKLLKSMGFSVEEEIKKEKNLLKTHICPNHVCGYENPGDAKFCLKCGYPLSLKIAVSLNKIKKKEEALQNELFSKDISNIAKKKDVRETMYEILRSDPKLVDKLKEIVELTKAVQK